MLKVLPTIACRWKPLWELTERSCCCLGVVLMLWSAICYAVLAAGATARTLAGCRDSHTHSTSTSDSNADGRGRRRGP